MEKQIGNEMAATTPAKSASKPKGIE